MFKRIFFTGLTAVIPLVITIYIIVGLFYFADGILGASINKYLGEYIDYEIPGVGIIISILLIFILGIVIRISRLKFFRWFSRWIEQVFFKMPLVSKIYFPIRKIVYFLFFPPKKSFKSAVLVEYPRKGVYSLGFVTNENTLGFNDKKERRLYNVFIPSSPSPMTGFTIIVEEKELVFLDIAIDDALKLVISGGLLNP